MSQSVLARVQSVYSRSIVEAKELIKDVNSDSKKLALILKKVRIAGRIVNNYYRYSTNYR
jgi:hypothetical protein